MPVLCDTGSQEDAGINGSGPAPGWFKPAKGPTDSVRDDANGAEALRRAGTEVA